MNTIYRLTTLFALTLSAFGADVKFSALPTATSPSTNSYLPIIDLNLLPAAQNQKYLLTNLALVSYVNGRGGGNMTNTGASVSGYLPVYTDTTGTQVTPTNTLQSLAVGALTVPFASKAVATDASSNLVASATTATELGYVSGVTSAIQGQLNGKFGITQIGTLTHAGTVTLTNGANYSEADIVLTGAVTFATSDLAAGRKYTLYGRNTQATNCTPTFPSWRWMGGAPSTITALKEFTLSLSSRGTVDTNVWAAYAEAP